MRPSDTPAAATRRALIALGKEQGKEYNALLEQLARERWVFRLGAHARRAELMVKGATLLPLWVGEQARPTAGLDLLDLKKHSADALRTLLQEVCSAPLPNDAPQDGLMFDTGSLQLDEPQRTDSGYVFVGFSLPVHLEATQTTLRIDVASGDMPTPPPEEATLPALLAILPPAKARVSSRDSFLAEKLHMCLGIGLEHLRMQDLHDLYLLAQHAHFAGNRLSAAIRHTLERRIARLPTEDLPPFLSPDFLRSTVRNAAWSAYRRRLHLQQPQSLPELMSALQMFFITPLEAMARNRPFTANWQGAGLWE